MVSIKLFQRILLLLGLATLVLLMTSCGSKPPIGANEPYWKDDDRKPIPEPDFCEPPLIWTSVDRSIFDQGLEFLDLDRNFRKISGNMTEAKNTNSFDEVPNSSWFTNRMGLPCTQLTPQQVMAGVNHTGGPDTAGPWMVFRPKIGGVTPGFWIEDQKGNKYIIKFDPKGYPDMSTGATVMAGRFFYACGYNVAQETIVYWRPEMLRVREGATVKGTDGEKRPLTMEDIENILDHVERQPDGSIRSLASLLLGNVKGPYSLKGTRKNDPNDWCPHEHRRELRGLYVMASFANHFDIKDANSMDVYVGESGQGHLEHYLLDFGSTFGSAGHGPMRPIHGYANIVDLRDMLVSITTLGLKKWQWEDATPVTNPSVGYYEADIFHPGKWDPIYPIPPFENMTDRDGYWGAKIMMAFRDEHLRALLAAGEYRDEEAVEILFETMKKRRDEIGRYWFSQVNPLDHPIIRCDQGAQFFEFTDLALKYELEDGDATYRYEILEQGRRIHGPVLMDSTRIPLADLVVSPNEIDRRDSIFELRIETDRGISCWSPPTIFWLRYYPESMEFRVVGIEHPS